jgi:alpha 1,3-glucosidase
LPLPEDGNRGNVGIYWVNSAETWAELYTANYTKDDQEDLKRGAFWSSETNLLEFVLILSKTPKDLLVKWQLITGVAPLPPYFSLGYHQSRWSYFSAGDVSNLNFRFDFYDLPLDVVWLDIDATRDYEYFTWNPHRFDNSSIDVMYDRLSVSHRKIVVISDPHIRKNDTYYLYQ